MEKTEAGGSSNSTSNKAKDGGILADCVYDQLPISNIKKIHPIQYYRHLLAQGIRADGRNNSEFRHLDIKTDTMSRCVGSSSVRLGRTAVVCGIKAEITVPDLARSDEGYFVVNVHVPALCYSPAESKLDSDIPIFATQCVSDLIESARVLENKALCIEPGKSAWVLYADITCINYQGNLMDTSIIALMAALKDLKLPKILYDNTVNSVIIPSNERYPVNLLKDLLIPSTVGVFDEKYIVSDPVAEEEPLCTIVSVITDGKDRLFGVIKCSGGSIDQNVQKAIIKHSKLRSAAILPLLEKSCHSSKKRATS